MTQRDDLAADVGANGLRLLYRALLPILPHIPVPTSVLGTCSACIHILSLLPIAQFNYFILTIWNPQTCRCMP
jgi:hypothetical protein